VLSPHGELREVGARGVFWEEAMRVYVAVVGTYYLGGVRTTAKIALSIEGAVEAQLSAEPKKGVRT
jgi:hypothetical protein